MPIYPSTRVIASPTLTGDPTAPTATSGDDDTSVATTEFVTDAIATQAAADADTYERRTAAHVDAFGADPSGATDSTSAFQAALASLPTQAVNNGTGSTATYHYGTILLGSGVYKIGSTGDIGNIGPWVSLIGPGSTACTIAYYGSGDCIRMYNAVKPSDDTWDTMFAQGAPHCLAGEVTGFTLDGTHAGNGAAGWHVGDFEGLSYGPDLTIGNFTGTGSIGVHLDNYVSWTENFHGHANVHNCTTLIRYSRTSGDSSFAYNDFSWKTYAFRNQDVIVITGGAKLYNGSLRMRGNAFTADTTNTGAFLRITGNSDDLQYYSGIDTCFLDCKAEVNRISDTALGHQTIAFGDVAKNRITNCTGFLSFLGNVQSSNWSPRLNNHLGFQGVCVGDSVLAPVYTITANDTSPTRGVINHVTPLSVLGYYDTATRTVDLASSDFFDLGYLASGNNTVLFANPTLGPRRILIRCRQPTDGGSNITWPTNDSPSQVNPTVLWENGVPPVVTQPQYSIDVFELTTVDGAVWYGRRWENMQAVGTIPTVFANGSDWATSANPTNSRNVHVSSSTVVGNTLVMVMANTIIGDASTPTITDPKGNTWTIDATAGSATGVHLWVAHSYQAASVAPSDSIVVSWSGVITPWVSCVEVTGLGASPRAELSAVADSGASAATVLEVGSAYSTRTANSLAIAAAVASGTNVNGTMPTWTVSGPGTGWYNTKSGSSNDSVMVAYELVPKVGTEPWAICTPSLTDRALAAAVVTVHA